MLVVESRVCFMFSLCFSCLNCLEVKGCCFLFAVAFGDNSSTRQLVNSSTRYLHCKDTTRANFLQEKCVISSDHFRSEKNVAKMEKPFVAGHLRCVSARSETGRKIFEIWWFGGLVV